MSFLSDLKSKIKNLNHTKTLVRNIDGTLFKEDVHVGSSEVVSKGLGYVVDYKPNVVVTEVIQGLLMGSQDVAYSETLLKNYCVKCVISLGIEVPTFYGIKYVFLEVLDLPEYSILGIFEQCFLTIDTEREKGNIVFVHCNAGISRSASLVIGYIMKKCKMSFEMAYEYIRSKRPSVRPNEGFIKQLLKYEKYLNETKTCDYQV